MTSRSSTAGLLLVVDDNRVNRLVLQKALEALGHETVAAVDGEAALALLEQQPFDAVLLDIEMPVLDGFGTLQRIKGSAPLRHLPVIMVSSVDDIDSVVRCIELGAVDYLQKPFNGAILRARVDAALAEKRSRDAELDLLLQVDRLVDAAEAIENSTFEVSTLEPVAARTDAIGGLGRVFMQMAERVVEREQRLARQINQLRRDAAVATRAAGSPAINRLASYLAIDRRIALAEGRQLEPSTSGAVLLSDVSGFTAAVIARSEELGSDRGAEELLSDLNDFYDRCVQAIHHFGGAVVGFAGDGITSWFDDRHASVDAIGAAVAAGLELQAIAANNDAFAGLKTAVAAGRVHRLVLGDADHQLLDVLWGAPVAEATATEREAKPGEVLAAPSVANELLARADVHLDEENKNRSGVAVTRVENVERHSNPWPALDFEALGPEHLRPWLIPAVYDSVLDGQPGFLAELRSTTALFANIEGVRIESPDGTARLDRLVRWIQSVSDRHGGSLLQLTPTEAGGYFYLCFGAPRAVPDDAGAALACAVELVETPAELDVGPMRVGLARGPMRIGGYGGADHTTYGAIGRQTNLAARLMQTARPRTILADESVLHASGRHGDFEPVNLGPLKGIQGTPCVFRFARINLTSALDDLEPALASTAKIASIFPSEFEPNVLSALHLDDSSSMSGTISHAMEKRLDGLCRAGILMRSASSYVFADQRLRREAHGRLLYAQRRALHRAALDYLNSSQSSQGTDPVAWRRSLAHHAEHAEDHQAAAALYEQAAELAQERGRTSEALEMLKASLRFELGDRPAT